MTYRDMSLSFYSLKVGIQKTQKTPRNGRGSGKPTYYQHNAIFHLLRNKFGRHTFELRLGAGLSSETEGQDTCERRGGENQQCPEHGALPKLQSGLQCPPLEEPYGQCKAQTARGVLGGAQFHFQKSWALHFMHRLS